MTTALDTSSAVVHAVRWVLALTVRGVAGGVAHAALAATISAVIQAGDGLGDLPGVIGVTAVIGAVVGGVLAVCVGVVTAPAAARAASRGTWGCMRPWVIGLPAAAIVIVAVLVAPPWPTEPVDPFVLSDFIVTTVWFYVGPACWAGWFLYRLTDRWPR